MVLEESFQKKLAEHLALLKHELVIKASLDGSKNSQKVKGFLEYVANLSSKISIEETRLSRTPCFGIARKGEDIRVAFAGLPLGHELDSFIMAIQQIDGCIPLVDESLRSRLTTLDKKVHFETYVSLSCRNCPTVVQSLNLLAILNPNISHTMVEGKMFYEERVKNNVLTVPTIFLNGIEAASGRKSIEQLLDIAIDTNSVEMFSNKNVFDLLVIGGGPAGNSAAIYAARKGLNVGMIVESYGGKVMDIAGVENMIGIPYTEGPRLMGDVEIHVNQFYVDMMKGQRAKAIRKKELIEVELKNEAVLKAKTVIIAVGAVWEQLDVPGEEQFFTKGVTNCPHCDGPLFLGKDVAVIGGGNQAIEGALDLANQAEQVYVLQASSTLSADKILQNRLHELQNVTILTDAMVTEIHGNDCVSGLTYVDGETEQPHTIALDGVFVQTKLVPNTNWLTDSAIVLNEQGEIVVDSSGMTSLAGVFAAGDCTNSRYKQIIISMGSGATAALGAFDYLIRQ